MQEKQEEEEGTADNIQKGKDRMESRWEPVREPHVRGEALQGQSSSLCKGFTPRLCVSLIFADEGDWSGKNHVLPIE